MVDLSSGMYMKQLVHYSVKSHISAFSDTKLKLQSRKFLMTWNLVFDTIPGRLFVSNSHSMYSSPLYIVVFIVSGGVQDSKARDSNCRHAGAIHRKRCGMLSSLTGFNFISLLSAPLFTVHCYCSCQPNVSYSSYFTFKAFNCQNKDRKGNLFVTDLVITSKLSCNRHSNMTQFLL